MYLTLIKTFLTAKKTWLKIAAIAILTIVCLAYVYNAGKESERSVWQEKESKFLAKQEAIKKLHLEAIERQQNEYEKILLGVINEYEKERTDLDNRIAELSTQRMYVNTKKCTGSGGVSTKTKDIGQLDSTTDRTELFESDAENIRNDYATAQQLVNQYNDLRALCLPLVEVAQ